MKSEHRHDLETNELARRLAEVIRRVKPYSSSLLSVTLVLLALLVGFRYLQRSTAARQGKAWDVYNEAVEGRTPDADMLKQSAELYAGSDMAQLSEITWADGQLWQATRRFINFRDSAMDSLSKAESAYLNLVNSAGDPRIRDRAHFGLARVYEMRNELDKARSHYQAVTGGFAEVAQQRAAALGEERVIQATQWLASARPTPRRSPVGPGIPGEKPDFEADELDIYAEEMDEGPGLGEMLESFGRSGEDDEDRYSLELPDLGVATEGAGGPETGGSKGETTSVDQTTNDDLQTTTEEAPDSPAADEDENEEDVAGGEAESP